jgi:sigma-E factor negative regulatory protein RseA
MQFNELGADGSRAELISAALDGESLHGHGAGADRASITALGDFLTSLDDEGRTRWTDYHVVGDALRSDDLAGSPAASYAFLARFSARLESEPHLMAPTALQANVRRGLSLRRRVLPAFAVAAAAATLTWIVVPQLQGVGTGATAQMAADAPPAVRPVQRVALAPTTAVATGQAPVAEANIIRDANLDQYLEAHQQFAQQPMVTSDMPLMRTAVTSESK